MKTRDRIETGILVFKVARLVTLLVASCAAPQSTPSGGTIRATTLGCEDSNLRSWIATPGYLAEQEAVRETLVPSRPPR